MSLKSVSLFFFLLFSFLSFLFWKAYGCLLYAEKKIARMCPTAETGLWHEDQLCSLSWSGNILWLFSPLWQFFSCFSLFPCSASHFVLCTFSVYSVDHLPLSVLGIFCLTSKYLIREVVILVIYVWAGTAVLSILAHSVQVKSLKQF